jgi:hypothetical protein
MFPMRYEPQMLHSAGLYIGDYNMFPMRYELSFYIPEDDILHSLRREKLKSYIVLIDWAIYRRCNVFPVRYELGIISQKTALFIVTGVKTSDLTQFLHILYMK